MTTTHFYWNLFDPDKSGEYPEGIAVYGNREDAEACAFQWRQAGHYKSVRVYQRPIRVAGVKLQVYCVVRTSVNTHNTSEETRIGS